jgi:ABC-type dipeptide/oligopeptide/nickel transport system ATPase subunit
MSHYCCSKCWQRYEDCLCDRIPKAPEIISDAQNQEHRKILDQFFAVKVPVKPDYLEIAKDSAWNRRYSHEYIPLYRTQFVQWVPHKWIIEAIENAYQRGLVEGSNKKENE